jgi:hypothetical protein
MKTPLGGWANGWSLPDRRSVPDWAREHVKLGGGYARQGSFEIETCRHLVEPFAAVQSDHVREITCRAAIQLLKTLFVEITSLWAIANEPGPIMWTQQDDDSAKEHTKGRYRGLLRNCEPVARLLPRDRHDRSTNEIYFGDFYLLVNGANLNNLQSKSIRWKINSECWLWKQGLLTHARRRVSAYARDGISKILNESQGSVSGDDFDKLWHEGTQEIWAVPCAGCHTFQPLEFFARMAGDEKERAGVTWAADAQREDGTWKESRVRETVRWRCPACGHQHENSAKTRSAWNSGGGYLLRNLEADGRHRSFTWNALIADDLGTLAMEFLNASIYKKRGIIQPLKDFYMQRLALAWKDMDETLGRVEVVTLSDYTLAAVGEDPKAKITNEARRFMTIDRQRDHFWAVVRAWRSDGTSRLLWRGKILTVEQAREIGAKYDVENKLTGEDAQYSTDQVYQDCVKYEWTALHGSGDDTFTHHIGKQKLSRYYSPIKYSQVPGGMARYMFWASDPVKDVLAGLRKAGGHELPSDIGDEYLRQLGIPQRQQDGTMKQTGGEVKRERVSKSTGRSEWRWSKVGPNHFLDCEAMQVAFALALGILSAENTQETNNTNTEEKNT